MRGVYRLVDTISSVTTKKTLLWIATSATKPIEILSARITCQNEDTSEQIVAELNRITTIGSAAGTTITPKQTEEGSANFTGTCASNLTTEPTTYDDESSAIGSGGANKLAGWEYVPLPEERAIVGINDNVGLRLIDDIANASNLTAEIVFREIG